MFTACFIVWQLGILFYSDTSMSLFRRTPIPITKEYIILIIGLGYILSIIFICLFPRKTVYAERILLPIAFSSTILMLFSFSPQVLTILFYIETFVCVFSIGTMASLASHLFTIETTWRDAIIGLSLGGLVIAFIQNDFFKVSFTIFTFLSLLMIATLALFHYLIPAKIEVQFISKHNKRQMPKILFWGTLMLNVFSTLLLCLASSFAESFKHGISIYYFFGAVFAMIGGYLKKRYTSYSIKIFSTYFMITVVGFVLASFSLQVPQLKPFACILLSCIVVLANFWIFYCAIEFMFYPTRFIGAIGAMQGLVLALIHSCLLQVLRNNLALLYGLYALLSVVMMLCYYFLEPYFIYAWKQYKKPKVIVSNTKLLENNPKTETKEKKLFAELSDQEQILADLILRGYTESDIAKQMNITLNTQKSYRKNLYSKLNIHSKRELFELADNRV